MQFLVFLLWFSFLLLPSESKITTFAWFKNFFQKFYNNATEEFFREVNFNRSVQRVKRLRLENPNLKFGLNEFSDWSDQEWNRLFWNEEISMEEEGEGFKVIKQPFYGHFSTKKRKLIPDSIDWRKSIPDWPAQRQGECASCFAFASLAVIEAQLSIANNYLYGPPNLSKQEMVDCTHKKIDKEFTSNGCKGGKRVDIYKYVMKHGVGINWFYPYREEFNWECSREDILQQPHVPPERYTIGGWKSTAFNESDDHIMRLISEHGPVSSGIFSTKDIFRDYKGGVIRNKYPWHTKTNHAIVIVGYGYDEKEKADYWLIRNSHGPNWGEFGHFRLERGYNSLGINNKVQFAWI